MKKLARRYRENNSILTETKTIEFIKTYMNNTIDTPELLKVDLKNLTDFWDKIYKDFDLAHIFYTEVVIRIYEHLKKYNVKYFDRLKILLSTVLNLSLSLQ